ncbi:MAG: response regulator [gamma proteobacterium symbiont of Lucinoma myriamae]|nr:response regulator [gamma proteobacterium symbiont of Lucinoma myriamae]MCU7819824.1 response regulator [gamma proteobacterium symbiont of Lucinoma myriamae]MCU7833352.1 response regulator [gamma proteobacterium symbiont of Lucinoma myriamae]
MSTILLVDKTALITEIVSDQLSGTTEFGGYRVIKATNYQEAMEYIKHSQFDFLITEYYLSRNKYGTTLLEQCEKPGLLISTDDIKYKADAIGAGFINKNHGLLHRRIHDWIIRQPCVVTLN